LPTEQTIARFEAWWVGEIVDRPPVSLRVKSDRQPKLPAKRHATHRARWLDVEFQAESAIAQMEATNYAGDSFPVFNPNVGPEITAALFGCEIEFGETTSWSKPVVRAPDDWNKILARPADFDNIYWHTVERLTDCAIERCQGRYVVGVPNMHGNYDILAGLRGPQHLCMDLVDCPDLLRHAGRHVAGGYVEAYRRSYQKLSAAGFPSTTWCNYLHRGPASILGCDFWCMVSEQAARDMIWPDILLEMAPLERSIFHLDGPQALRHLDLLLECRQLNAVQWVFGAGRGPAARWTDVYRRIRQAGKSVELLAESAEDALAVLDVVGARGVWVRLCRDFDSAGEAEAFLSEVARRTH
jgi:hypothetical protein